MTDLDKRHGRKKIRVGRLVLAATVVVVTLWMLAPTLTVLPLSFVGESSFRLPPKTWSDRWYVRLAEDRGWIEALLNSLLVAALAASLATLLGTAAAFGMRKTFVGRQFFQALLVAPMIVPIVVYAIGAYAVFLEWGLTGTVLGFVGVHATLGVPYVFITVSAALQSMDWRLPDAASNLGASPLRGFLQVTLPLIAPSVMTGGLFAFMTSFDETVVSIFLVTSSMRTLPVAMYESVTNEIDPTVAAVAAVMLVLTTVVLSAGVLMQARRKIV